MAAASYCGHTFYNCCFGAYGAFDEFDARVVTSADPFLIVSGDEDGALEAFCPFDVRGVEVRVRDDNSIEAAFVVDLGQISGCPIVLGPHAACEKDLQS